MVTKKIVFNGLVIAILLTCNAQRAMEPEKSDDLKQLHLIHTITVDNKKQKIRYIHLSGLSNDVIQKLGGKPTNKGHLNDVLLTSSLSKIQIFDLKNKVKIYEANLLDILKYRSIRTIPTLKLIELKNEPLIEYDYDTRNRCLYSTDKGNRYSLPTYKYNLISKKLKREKNPNKKSNKYNIFSDCGNLYSSEHVTIYHNDYTAIITREKRGRYLRITNTDTGKETRISLPYHNCYNTNEIYASPHKKSPYILISSTQAPQYMGQYTKQIILYDNKTGNSIIDFTSVIPAINIKKLGNVVFGKHDDFILFCFKKEIFLYDLKTRKLVGKYTFEKYLLEDLISSKPIDSVVLSSDETEIIVATAKAIYFLKNPLVQPDMDLSERVRYLRNPEYIKENQEKIFNISFGGPQTTIPILKTLLLLNY